MMPFRFSAALVGLVLSVSTAQAGKPADPPPQDTPPPTAVVEQNLDGNGWIKVHEQGTAKVDIQNSSLNVNATIGNTELDVNVSNGPSDPVSVQLENAVVDVNVQNFPPQQPAPMPAVTEFEGGGAFVPAGESLNVPIAPLDAVLIRTNSAEGDDYSVTLRKSGEIHFEMDSDRTQSFFYPLPIDAVSISCFNLVDDCVVGVSIHGFAAQP